MTRRKRDERQLSERDILEGLPGAFRLLGQSMPTTPDEVARMEAALFREELQLPSRLADPFAVLNSASIKRAEPRIAEAPSEVLDELRQAARFGSEIPEDVRARMDQDRDREEGAAENQGEGD